MEARLLWAVALWAAVVSLGAGYRTANFIVEAPTPQLAEKIGKQAEVYRKELSQEWLGEVMPNWSRPCPIKAEVAPHLGAGGATSFVFDRGEVFGWDMKIQGSEERVLDSVLPHEVTHTIFASHFRRPLPRWADEGACTTVEHVAERTKQQQMLISFLRSNRGIAFHQMFAMKEYPADVLPLYSQGYSLARFLIDQGGKRKFLEYVGDGMKNEKNQVENWSAVTKRHYGYNNLAVLQHEWLEWVKRGSPKMELQPGEAIAAARGSRDRDNQDDSPVYRGQSPDDVKLASNENREVVLSRERPEVTNPRAAVVPASTGWTARDPNRPSVYDRRASGGENVPLEVAAASPAAPSPAPTPTTGREPSSPLMARRDDVLPPPTPRRVLLEWTKPETVQR